jgi:hypothetical protein
VALSPEVKKLIFEAARAAGDELKGKLPPHPMHPKGRNSHAHVFERIRAAMGKSYKDCDDWEASRILRIIERCVKHPC